MGQQWTCPEVQVGRHAFENITKDIWSSENATARCLPLVIFVVGGRGVSGGWGWVGGAILSLTVVTLQVVLQTGRLGAGIVTMRAPVGFLSWEGKKETEKQKGRDRENSE